MRQSSDTSGLRDFDINLADSYIWVLWNDSSDLMSALNVVDVTSSSEIFTATKTLLPALDFGIWPHLASTVRCALRRRLYS